MNTEYCPHNVLIPFCGRCYPKRVDTIKSLQEQRDELLKALRTLRDITSPGLVASSAYHSMSFTERLNDIHAKSRAALAKVQS